MELRLSYTNPSTWSKARHGTALINVHKFPYRRKQIRMNKLILCSSVACPMVNYLRSFKNSVIPLIWLKHYIIGHITALKKMCDCWITKWVAISRQGTWIGVPIKMAGWYTPLYVMEYIGCDWSGATGSAEDMLHYMPRNTLAEIGLTQQDLLRTCPIICQGIHWLRLIWRSRICWGHAPLYAKEYTGSDWSGAAGSAEDMLYYMPRNTLAVADLAQQDLLRTCSIICQGIHWLWLIWRSRICWGHALLYAKEYTGCGWSGAAGSAEDMLYYMPRNTLAVADLAQQDLLRTCSIICQGIHWLWLIWRSRICWGHALLYAKEYTGCGWSGAAGSVEDMLYYMPRNTLAVADLAQQDLLRTCSIICQGIHWLWLIWRSRICWGHAPLYAKEYTGSDWSGAAGSAEDMLYYMPRNTLAVADLAQQDLLRTCSIICQGIHWLWLIWRIRICWGHALLYAKEYTGCGWSGAAGSAEDMLYYMPRNTLAVADLAQQDLLRTCSIICQGIHWLWLIWCSRICWGHALLYAKEYTGCGWSGAAGSVEDMLIICQLEGIHWLWLIWRNRICWGHAPLYAKEYTGCGWSGTTGSAEDMLYYMPRNTLAVADLAQQDLLRTCPIMCQGIHWLWSDWSGATGFNGE